MTDAATLPLCPRQMMEPRRNDDASSWSGLLHNGYKRATRKKNTRSKSMFEWKALEHVSIDTPSRQSSTCTTQRLLESPSPTTTQRTCNSAQQFMYSLLGSAASSSSSTTTTSTTVSGDSPIKAENDVQKFLVRFSKALIACGAPSHRLDYCVQLLVLKLGLSAQYGHFPGFLIVSFGDVERDALVTPMQLIRVDAVIDLSRLTQLHQLFEAIVCDDMPIYEALDKLDHITSAPPFYPTWVTLLAYAVSAGSSASLFFSGGSVDMAISFALSLSITCGSHFLSRRITRFSTIFDVFLSAIIGFMATAAAVRLPSSLTCFYAMAIGSVVNILPGYSTLVSILEVTAVSVASGTLRLLTALIYSLLIGFGLAIGTSIHQLTFPSVAIVSSQAACTNGIPLIYQCLLVPIFAISNTVILQGPPAKYPIILCLAGIAQGVHSVTLQHFVAYPHLATIFASFSVSIVSNIYARCTPTVSFVDMIIGLFFLVPGSVGVTSSLDIFGQAMASITPSSELSVILNAGEQGIVFAAHMMVITVAISLGLVLAAIFIYPFRTFLDFRAKKPAGHYRRQDWVGDITF